MSFRPTLPILAVMIVSLMMASLAYFCAVALPAVAAGMP